MPSDPRVTLVVPALLTDRDDGLTIPLRHVWSGCAESSDARMIRVGRSPRPALSSIAGIAKGEECYASATYASNANKYAVASATDPSTVLVGFLGSTAALIRSVPAARRICIVQDSITNISRHNGRFNDERAVIRRILDKTNSRYERSVYADLDAVVVTTNSEKEFLERLGLRSRIVVNSNGVDVPTSLPTRVPDADVVLLGNYGDHRNLRCAQRALDVSVDLGKRFGRQIKVIAVGWQASRITAPAQGVELLIMEDVEDLDSVLSRGRCFMSLDPDSTGIKNSVLRLLSLGIPGVVTEQVARPFAATDIRGAMAVVDSSPAAAGRSIERLVMSDAYWQSCREDAMRVARSFSWQTYEARIANLIRES